VVGKIESTTRAGYFPGAGKPTVKMLAERGSGRLLGAQIVGVEGAAKRIDVFATASSDASPFRTSCTST
jgi:NADPH-dependent 2,4-dienoyl-CoA reductase/sulfur reductase-like enzyme